jgi:transcriptional regulator with XRE-family HTH domain
MTPDELFEPEAIATPAHFGLALDRLRRVLGMSISELARQAEMTPDSVSNVMDGRRLPMAVELHNLLLALGIRDREREEQWELTLVRLQRNYDFEQLNIRPYVYMDPKAAASSGKKARAESSDSEEGDLQDLLFRVYIPTGRLYATEASRLLALFHEWLITTRGYGIRRSGYQTVSGEMYEFFAETSVVQPDLREEFDSFSDFLTLCSEDTSAAADVLTSAGVDRTASVKLVARFGREVQRLQIDLRHEREQRMLTIRHGLEEQLLESGMDLRDIPRRQINSLVDSYVPGPTAPESLTLLAAPSSTRSAAPVTVINNPQIINALKSTIFQNVQGTVHLDLRAQKLLAFIEEFGAHESAGLQSAVYELDDSAAPPTAKSRAKERLKKFVNQVTGIGREVGIELLADYLKSKGM